MKETLDSGKLESPKAIEEAENDMASYRLRVGIGWFASVAAALVGGSQWLGLYAVEVLPYLIAPSAVAAGLIVYPLGKQVGWARRVLRRWDEIRTERALLPAPRTDPRARAARLLADRIGEHPASDAEAREVVERLVAQLEAALADLRAVEAMRLADTATDTTTDVRTDLEVRIARLLSGLAQLHRSLLLRDVVRTHAEMSEMRDLLAHIQAETEVEILLGGGPGRVDSID